jgi:predicted aspartyl protease
MIFPYAETWYPPMPVLEIRLGYPEAGLTLGPYIAIVDTAADGTIVPSQLIERLEAPFVDEVQLRSQWGEWRRAQVFTVDIGIDSLNLPAIEVVGDEQGSEIILGRNVLNRLHLMLDGPGATTEVLE